MACSGFEPQVSHDVTQAPRPDRRSSAAGNCRAGRRGRALAAAAEIVDAEDPKARRCRCRAPGPPARATSRRPRRRDTMRCAEMPPSAAITGASARPDEPKGNVRAGERIAVVQPPGMRQLEHAIDGSRRAVLGWIDRRAIFGTRSLDSSKVCINPCGAAPLFGTSSRRRVRRSTRRPSTGVASRPASAGVGTVPQAVRIRRWLPRLLRAFPSAGLDERREF